jgi:sulfatase maturation enzyme AslB (radical SAM superfamily)
LAYNAARHTANHDHLITLVNEIDVRCDENAEIWPLTDDVDRQCRFCTYRSLCNRGRIAGDLEDLDDDPELEPVLDIDLEQVAEIAFQ